MGTSSVVGTITSDSTAAIAVPRVREAGDDLRITRARTDLLRFGALLVQLGLLFAAFLAYDLEEPVFVLLMGIAFGGFALHYWLPFRLKETFWILLSIGGAFLLLDPAAAALLIGTGFGFFAIVRSPFSYRWKIALVSSVFVALMAGRALDAPVPAQFWPVFGAIFMFRMVIYLYDLRHFPGPASLKNYLTYFFVLPNYYFLLFPVIDFQTLRRSYFQRDIHQVAQQGIGWIVRGSVQLLIYRVISQLKGPSNAPDQITSFAALASAIVLTYLLYLRVSGHFHIIVGTLHLFGYDLPETHRRYLLARSLTDFWRRINIYWKDFMVKVVYFPVYFKLKRSGERRAQIVATAAVFTVTWLLHSYQWFWLKGEFLFTWPDTLFWAILGFLVTLNLLFEQKRRKREPVGRLGGALAHGLQVAMTFVLITTLWSMWNAPTMGEWFDVLTWWQVG